MKVKDVALVQPAINRRVYTSLAYNLLGVTGVIVNV